MKTSFLAIAVAAMAASSFTHASNIYHLGNSLTGDATFFVPTIAAAQGISQPWQYQISGNQTLTEYVKYNGEVPNGYGATPDPYQVALPGNVWDAITLQPHMGNYETATTEAAAAAQVIDVLRSNPANLNTRVFIYAAIAGKPNIPASEAPAWIPAEMTYAEMWNYDSEGGYDGNIRSREFYRSVFDQVKAARPDVDLAYVPVGDVYYEIEQRLVAGTLGVAEIDSMDDLYVDMVHMSEIGRFVAAVTMYDGLYETDLAGVALDVDGSGLSPESRLVLQSLVSDVIAATPNAVPEPASLTLLGMAGLLLGRRR